MARMKPNWSLCRTQDVSARRRSCALTIAIVLAFVAGAAPAQAASPRYCRGLQGDRAVATLPTALARFGDPSSFSQDVKTLRQAERRLARSAQRARGGARKTFRRSASALTSVRR